jgi:hypothetical protein
MRNFFKFFWFPVLLIAGCVTFASYMAWKEFRTQDALVNEALQGNRYAIAILRKYEKPWKLDTKVIHEALQGNAYALEILKIAPVP